MASDGPPAYDRVIERRRAVVLARHFRETEGLSIAQIADRLGRSPATIKAYFYDPTGERARAVKARYVGVCRGCGAYTQPRNGKGDAYRYCKRCHPGAIERKWTGERVIAADVGVACALRLRAVLLRLVAHAREATGRQRARATQRGGMAVGEGRQPRLRIWEEAREAAWTEARKRSLARSRDASATASCLIDARVSAHDQCPS
jgi:AraC-like DNA-binding protein